MKFIISVIIGYIVIGLLNFLFIMLKIKYSERVSKFYQDKLKKLEMEFPTIEPNVIKDMMLANLVRSCILWPSLLAELIKNQKEEKL